MVTVRKQNNIFLKKSVLLLAAFAALLSGPFTCLAAYSGETGSAIETASDTVAPIAEKTITESEILAAQRAWGEGLVAISTAYDRDGIEAAKALTEKFIDGTYAYQLGPVLFKPTLASSPKAFRTTRKGAISYFIGGDPDFPGDKGFALKGWRKVEVQNAAIFIAGNTGTAMGNVIFTDKDGKTTKVDKTWEFFKDGNGDLRIVVHHSSLPYSEK
jgi:hypothetical protein